MDPVRYFQGILREAFKGEKWLSEPHELYRPIEYTLELGGKRIRPLLLLLANDLFGGQFEKALKPAIGIEVFHNFTLLHDDIMDQATLRRGKETVFKKYNLNVAILSGDTMFALAYDYVARVNPVHLPEVLELFTTTARQVCEGQQYDMNFENNKDVTIPDYLHMIRLKTAVLLACSLKIGAILANAPSEDADKLYAFGDNIGMAFQLQDDLLDTFGEEEKFGKEIGGDIVTGKKTFLYLKAMELAGPEDKKILENSFNDASLPPGKKIRIIKDIYQHHGIREIMEKEIENYFILALDSLAEINVSDDKKTGLISLSSSLLKRQN